MTFLSSTKMTHAEPPLAASRLPGITWAAPTAALGGVHVTRTS
jgi:hypothetical protein